MSTRSGANPLQAIMRDGRAPRRRHLRAFPALLRTASFQQGKGRSIRRARWRAADRRADAGAGRDPHRRGDRSRHRVAKAILDADAVERKFGVGPSLIPDLLALVGDAADGYPGIRGIGAIGAARLLNRYGPIEAFPPEALGENRAAALLFKTLATL